MSLQYAVLNLTGRSLPPLRSDAWFQFILDHVGMIPSQKGRIYSEHQFDYVGPCREYGCVEFVLVNLEDELPLEGDFHFLLINYLTNEDRREIPQYHGANVVPLHHHLQQDVARRITTSETSQMERIKRTIWVISQMGEIGATHPSTLFASGNKLLSAPKQPIQVTQTPIVKL